MWSTQQFVDAVMEQPFRLLMLPTTMFALFIVNAAVAFMFTATAIITSVAHARSLLNNSLFTKSYCLFCFWELSFVVEKRFDLTAVFCSSLVDPLVKPIIG